MNTHKNNRGSLIYRDNGKRFPEHLDYNSSESFGLDVSKRFTEKLGAKIDYKSREGLTEFRIELNIQWPRHKSENHGK